MGTLTTPDTYPIYIFPYNPSMHNSTETSCWPELFIKKKLENQYCTRASTLMYETPRDVTELLRKNAICKEQV